MKITRDQVVYAMSRDNAPVATVASGSEVTFETCDCFSDQITSADAVFNELDWQRINPATGPVFIEGAEPGDCLKVSIKRITAQNQPGVMQAGRAALYPRVVIAFRRIVAQHPAPVTKAGEGDIRLTAGMARRNNVVDGINLGMPVLNAHRA